MPRVQTIAVLEGDQTGQELLEEALRVLASDVIGSELGFARFDLSLEGRRATENAVVYEAAAAIREHGYGLKAATVTPEGAGDVGSPNRILREEIGGKVIVRTGRRIPGVVPLGGVHAPISVVRMAVGDAYGAKEWREGTGDDEVALRTERIERRICHAVAEFAFRQAERTGAMVFGGPKYTVSPIYEGMLKEEMDEAAARHPEVPYEPQLIDATFALLISSSGAPMVIPALNRDGASARREGRGEPDGDDPRRRGAALSRRRRGSADGRASDPRGVSRSGRRGGEDRGSERAREHHRVHGRGHPPDADQARRVGVAVTVRDPRPIASA
jgi:hypothetical protein